MGPSPRTGARPKPTQPQTLATTPGPSASAVRRLQNPRNWNGCELDARSAGSWYMTKAGMPAEMTNRPRPTAFGLQAATTPALRFAPRPGVRPDRAQPARVGRWARFRIAGIRRFRSALPVSSLGSRGAARQRSSISGGPPRPAQFGSRAGGDEDALRDNRGIRSAPTTGQGLYVARR